MSKHKDPRFDTNKPTATDYMKMGLAMLLAPACIWVATDALVPGSPIWLTVAVTLGAVLVVKEQCEEYLNRRSRV